MNAVPDSGFLEEGALDWCPMRLFTTLRRGAIAATIVTGLALFASALQGVARVDTALDVAASRATPDGALVQETRGGWSARGTDCPHDDGREPV